MRLSGASLGKTIFALLLVGLSLFIFVRHRQIEERGSLRWYDRTLLALTSPVARGITFARERVRLIAGRYVFLVRVERENESLRQRVGEYKTRDLRRGELESEVEGLRRLVGLRDRLPGEWIAARVVSYPPIGPYRVLTVDKGEEDGVRRRAAVVSPDGLVGQVMRVAGRQCQILLITDPTSAVDARIESGSGGASPGPRGLIVGKTMKLGLDRELFIGAFEYLSEAVEVPEGTSVKTSGLDGVYPPGILIGTIRAHQKKKFDVFQQVEVIPAVDFNRLRDVLILKGGPS